MLRNTTGAIRSTCRLDGKQARWTVHEPLVSYPQQETQMLFFKAATQKALTTVLAGFAFTMVSFPKISLLPALVAGFTRVLIITNPGMVNLPLFFTSLVATSAKLSSTLFTTAGFCSVAAASAAAMPLFDKAAPALAAFFIAFIAGAMATCGRSAT